jgi:hypothetical protein
MHKPNWKKVIETTTYTVEFSAYASHTDVEKDLTQYGMIRNSNGGWGFAVLINGVIIHEFNTSKEAQQLFTTLTED